MFTTLNELTTIEAIVSTQEVYSSTCRSSRSEEFYKIGVHKNFAKFTGKHLYQSFISFLIKLQASNFLNMFKFLLTFFIDIITPLFHVLRLHVTSYVYNM